MDDPEFDWHEAKRLRNLRDHEIDFIDAALVWDDPHRQERVDDRHDYGETRYQTIGMTRFHVLFVVYADRIYSDGAEVIWLISARLATPREEMLYRMGVFSREHLS